MRPGIVSALVVFAAAAAGLLALRDTLTKSSTTQAEAAPAAASAVIAPTDTVAGGRTAWLRKEADGHYWTTAYINGTPTRFMVDTGATVIALTKRDAQRIGFNTDKLPKNAEVSTAHGKVKVAAAMLDTVTIDRVEVSHVQAVVVDDGLDQSLLGMSFLNALHDWNATPEAIIIRQ
ncbi:MAG: TIGR02281 family clan AA aspartic protease [Alphaproteobacteria bacterium]